MSRNPSVIIVEDEFLISNYLASLCNQMSIDVLGSAAHADEAIAMILDLKPNYVLMDVRLQGKRDGVDIANRVHESLPHIRIIYVTGSSEPPTIDRINTDNPFRILIKPINPDELRSAFEAR